MQSLALIALALVVAPAADGPRTYDGRHDISKINLTVAYFVPADRKPLPDWRDRVDYYLKRITAFQARELNGRSVIEPHLHPEPLVSKEPSSEFRQGDQNATYFRTMKEVRTLLDWKPDSTDGFPILLVLSDVNWRELDDFQRTRIVDGQAIHEGHVGGDGRHFPGAESGGARAIYDARRGYGMGLVSGDGWRVPYSGSDCVVYHEGIGHAIGLPHPEPIDNSVMGTAQYESWISQTRLNASQRTQLLGSEADEPNRSRDLFSTFTALQTPRVPKAGEPVALELTWPAGAVVRELRVRVQTDLFAPWESISNEVKGKPPTSIPLKTFDHPTPVSYRVDATLEDGQTAEIWGYFQVKPAKPSTP